MARDLAPTTGRVTESRLVERACAGDHDAFALLVVARVEPTFRTAMAILGNEADARDATQEIFLRAWTHLPELREPALFPAWLGRIVVNACRSAIRGRKRRQIHEIPAGAFLVDGEWVGPSMEAHGAHDDRAAEVDLLDRALDRLSAADRTLLALHHYERLPLEQVGVLLGVPAKTVKSRLFSARRALERALEVERR